ncbi:hypothetical protein WME97_08275 [Sorangium sp. So ce367]|uniref:hypothetical protein n=1 Tax=Sorangium sp. So ce367 TaxID=3133305 RepID=UPI003F62CAC9
METSPTPTTWIALGTITVAALVAAYNLRTISREGVNQPQSHQEAVNKDVPDLQSTLIATQKKLASCEKTLQRRDPGLQKRDEKPHTSEDNPTLSPEPDCPKQCVVASQARSLNTTGANCRNFRWHFDAYKKILGSDTLDCDTVLSIRDLAQMQYSLCVGIIKTNEDAHFRDATRDPLAVDAVEDAYATRSEYGDIDINELVKKPECIARLRAE